jgi:hypothetical protein
MRYKGSLAFCTFCLLTALALAGDPALQLPKKVTGKPGAFIEIKAQTLNKVVKWYALDEGLNVFPVELLRDTKTLVVVAPQEGSYRIIAWTAEGDVPSDAATCLVVVGDSPDPPPPAPPDPAADNLTKALRQAYLNDKDPQKAQHLAALKRLYKDLAPPHIRDNSVQTLGDLFDALQQERKKVLADGDLLTLRTACGDYLNQELRGKPSDLLDRKKAQQVFATLSKSLQGVR